MLSPEQKKIFCEEGALNEDIHARLILDLDRIAQVAGIPRHFIWTGLCNTCGHPKEIDYVWHFRQWRHKEIGGVAYTGQKFRPSIPARMSAIAGTLIRNFVDARVKMLDDVLTGDDSGSSPTALLIPDFCLKGSRIPKNGTVMTGILFSRFNQGLQTVVHVEDMDHLETCFGQSVRQHITDHFFRIKDHSYDPDAQS